MRGMRFAAQIGILALVFQGCSVHMALNQPDPIDYKSLEQGGMSRDLVIGRLGTPVSSIKNADGTRTDSFQFYEGSSGWKYGRATFNLLADIVTIALWELVAWPAETVIRGDKVSATALFDQQENLVKFTVHNKGNDK